MPANLNPSVLLFPVLVAVTIVKVITDKDPKFLPLGRLIFALQAAFGFLIIGLTIWGLYSDYGRVFSWLSLKAFLLPILLGLVFIPLSYCMALVAAYEMLLIPLKFGDSKPCRYGLQRIFESLCDLDSV